MRRLKAAFIWLVFSFALVGCGDSQGESVVSTTHEMINSIENTNVNESQISDSSLEQSEKDTYYLMTYTNDVNVEGIMRAILDDEAELKAFEKVKMEAVTSKHSGLTSYKGSMTVDGKTYWWEKCEGSFSYSIGYLDVAVDLDAAEREVNEFLKRLGWEYGNEVELEKCEDGTVEAECRLYYDDIKLMGEHTFYFEPENENEVGVSGFFINMVINGDGIMSLTLSAVPQTGEILQEYDLEKDLLNSGDIKKIVKKYLEIQEQVLERMDLTIDELKMGVELIYMPYKDISRGGIKVLMPAYEVRIPSGPAVRARTMVLYIDAITGYVYDRSYEF